MRLLEGHEEKLKSIDTDLWGIKCDMLLINDYKGLAGRAGGLEEASVELQVAIRRLLKNIESESTASKDTGLRGVKFPKISVLTFDGKILSRKCFWKCLMPLFIARPD